MTDKTILVIDLDRETEEEIISALEAEDYLVFAASGREITSGTAGKISPALIFLKPTANSAEGFETCKIIHSNEAFKDVPIIVIASLKGALDARYTSFYGIVDYMEMPVNRDAIIEKTEKVLGGKLPDLKRPVVADIVPAEKENTFLEEGFEEHDKNPVDQEFSEEDVQSGEDYSLSDEEDNVTADVVNKGRRRRPGKSGLLVPILLVTALIVVAAGGFLTYKFFFSQKELHAPVKVAPPKAVEQNAPAGPPAVAQKPKNEPVLPAKPVETKEAPVKAVPKAPAAPPAVAQQPVSQAKPVETKEATKKVVQKAPVAVPAAKHADETFYSVQLGAFKSEAGAEALAKTLRRKGYEAFTHKGTAKDNKTLYRVLIGKFKSRKEALTLSDKLRTKDKIKTIVFSEGMN